MLIVLYFKQKTLEVKRLKKRYKAYDHIILNDIVLKNIVTICKIWIYKRFVNGEG